MTVTQFHTLNGVRSAYTIVGGGQPIVVVHGWGANISLMQPLADALVPHGFQVFAPDMPGFGESAPPDQAWTMDDYARYLIAFLDTHQLERVDYIGHSFGGRLGLMLGADYPQRINKMVLIDSAGIPPRRAIGSQMRLSAYKTIRDGLYRIGAKTTADTLRAWYVNRYGSPDYKETSGAMRDTFVNVIGQDLRPVAARVRVSTLLLWGEADLETPLWMGKALEQIIPDAGLVTFPGAGHYSYLERLPDTVRIIKHFFRQTS